MAAERLRILMVADGRSPIALNWIAGLVDAGLEVHLQSTFPARPELPLASCEVLPVAFGAVSGSASRGEAGSGLRRVIPVGVRTALRQWIVPRSLPKAAGSLQAAIQMLQPDLIHAMRIPFEGMLSALAVEGLVSAPPLLVSIWGNDFTLHAPATRRMAELTRLTLKHAAALHADCQRDLRLANEWGFREGQPAVVLPGGGGVQPEIFFPEKASVQSFNEPLTVIQPRGFRAYVQNEAFFRAIPLILHGSPGTRFIFPGMANEAQAQEWVRQFNLSQSVVLLPFQTRQEMAELFRRAAVIVSPTTHDGTPNTLLEALACGCFPVAGDLESLREWITPGVNGLLCDPTNPQALADTVVQALASPELRGQAQPINLKLIAERASFPVVMEKAQVFYRQLVKK
ncbi:MAG TPA: glycosyltransferase family 4 protein [Anaerolineales bacterium]|nr:glycosyltransferase family 4 protein [Anaerolineales bacterium]